MFSMVPFGIPYDTLNCQHESKCILLDPGTLIVPSLLLVLNFGLGCQIVHKTISREMFPTYLPKPTNNYNVFQRNIYFSAMNSTIVRWIR